MHAFIRLTFVRSHVQCFVLCISDLRHCSAICYLQSAICANDLRQRCVCVSCVSRVCVCVLCLCLACVLCVRVCLVWVCASCVCVCVACACVSCVCVSVSCVCVLCMCVVCMSCMCFLRALRACVCLVPTQQLEFMSSSIEWLLIWNSFPFSFSRCVLGMAGKPPCWLTCLSEYACWKRARYVWAAQPVAASERAERAGSANPGFNARRCVVPDGVATNVAISTARKE